ncbi:MAG: hypothetical protein AAF288_01940 [Planctomycetota bacterium]
MTRRLEAVGFALLLACSSAAPAFGQAQEEQVADRLAQAQVEVLRAAQMQEQLAQAEADAAAAGEALQDAREQIAGAEDGLVDAVDAPTDAELLRKLTVTPQSLSVNMSVNFDEEGHVRHRNENGSVSVSVKFDPDQIRVVSYEQLRMRRVVTFAGDVIELGEDDNRHHGRSRINGRSTQIGVSGQLPSEVLAARGIRRLEADFEMRVGLGEPEMAVLEPLSRFYGKRVAIADLPGSWFRVDKNANGVRVTANLETFERFDEPEIYDDRGRKLEARGWSSGSNGQTQYREYRVPAPDEGRMILWLDREVRDLVVPVVIEDVPMPGGEGVARPDLVIRLGPPDRVLREQLEQRLAPGAEGRNRPAQRPLPDGPQVELRIEGEEIEERGEVREGLQPGLGGPGLAEGEAWFAEPEPMRMDAPRVIGDLHLRGAPVIPFEDVQVHEPAILLVPC